MAPAEQRTGVCHAALSLGLLLSTALVVPAFAGDGASFAEQNGPVIVDRGAAIASAPRPRRPVPGSVALTSHIGQVANLRVEVSTRVACGTRSAHRLVVCLDTDGRFAAADELALLARLPHADAVEVGSAQARHAVIAAADRAGLPRSWDPVITAFVDCTGACGGRVVVTGTP